MTFFAHLMFAIIFVFAQTFAAPASAGVGDVRPPPRPAEFQAPNTGYNAPAADQAGTDQAYRDGMNNVNQTQQNAQNQQAQSKGPTLDECEEEETEAQKACQTQDMSAGMSAAQQAQAAQLQQQAQAANQQVGSAGAQAAAQCQNQADLSKILGGLSALKGGACLTAAKSCDSTCGDAEKNHEQKALQAAAQGQTAQVTLHEKKAKKAAKIKKTCAGYGGNSSQAFAQAAAMMANMFANLQCAKANATQSMTATPTPAADCTDPTFAATNLTCLCSTVPGAPNADPKNPLCGNGQATGTSISGNGPMSGDAPYSSMNGIDTPSDGSLVDLRQDKANTASGTNKEQGGGGSGGPTALGGNNGAGMGNDGGGAAPGDPKTVITGQSGGSGGGGLSAPGGGGGGSGSGGRGGRDEDDKGFSLSGLFPNKRDYKNRGLAGMSISSKDGVTGPMGPSLFEKVSSQVQHQKQKSGFILDK